jgi:hypothetical protein
MQEYRIISILLISPPKVIYAELICVKDTPHFFPNLFQNHPVYLNLKVVDVFSFHLQIFHGFIAPPSRRYFQGHSP